MPRHWYGGDPFATHFLNALSSVFPDGEAFFVRSVLRYRDQIDDPELLARIRGFAGQEGQHSHQHDLHVKLMLDQGYEGLQRRNRFMVWVLDKTLYHAPLFSLASTVAIEHLTAILARKILSHNQAVTGPMDARMGPLWTWHALEEAEHKSVAFDVYRHVAPKGRWRLALAQALNTAGLIFEIPERTAYMLRVDGLCFRRKVWADGLRFLLGKDGLLRGMGRDYLSFYRRSFHPDDVDDRALVAEWSERIEAGIREARVA